MIENHRVGLKDQTFQSANPANQLISRALQWSIPVFVEKVGDEGFEEVGDGVVAEAAEFVALEEAAGLKILEVGTGGVVGDGVPVLVLLEGVMVVGVAEGVVEEVELACVELALKSLAPTEGLCLFVFDVGMKVAQAADKDAEVDEHAIGGIEVAGLHVEIGLVIGGAFLAEHTGDGDVGGNPVTIAEEAPVKESTGGTAIAVPEGVFVGQERVEEDSLEDGVEEGVACLGVLVGEGDEGGHAGGQLGGRGRLVDDLIIAVANDDVVCGAITALGGLGEEAVSEGTVDAGKEIFGEGLAAPGVEVTDGGVIVGDHALSLVARGAFGEEHLLGDLAGGGGTFHLAGGDGLGNSGILEVSPSMVRKVVAAVCATKGDGDGRFAVNFVEQTANLIRHREEEGVTAHASKGGIDDRQLTGQAKGRPPDLGGDTIWGGVAGLAPRVITALGLGGAQKVRESHNPRPGDPGLEGEIIDLWCRLYPHNHSFRPLV